MRVKPSAIVGLMCDRYPPPEWWAFLDALVRRLVVVDEALAVLTSLVAGEPKLSVGRSVEGWQQRACEGLAAVAAGRFDVVAVIGREEFDAAADAGVRAPIGGLVVEYDGVRVTLGVRVDDVGEIYARVDDPNRPN